MNNLCQNLRFNLKFENQNILPAKPFSYAHTRLNILFFFIFMSIYIR